MLFLLGIVHVNAQESAVDTLEHKVPNYTFYLKNNLLSDLTATLNLGLEVPLGEQTSLDLMGYLNPFEFGNNRKWKHLLVQPEFRWWTKQAFAGHFFGIHANWAYYNVGGLPDFLFSDYMNTHRFEGWGVGAGLSYGYRWNFGKDLRWGLEAVVGVGYAYLDYEVFDCGNCGKKFGEEQKHYFGPTKAAVNLVYGI